MNTRTFLSRSRLVHTSRSTPQVSTNTVSLKANMGCYSPMTAKSSVSHARRTLKENNMADSPNSSTATPSTTAADRLYPSPSGGAE